MKGSASVEVGSSSPCLEPKSGTGQEKTGLRRAPSTRTHGRQSSQPGRKSEAVALRAGIGVGIGIGAPGCGCGDRAAWMRGVLRGSLTAFSDIDADEGGVEANPITVCLSGVSNRPDRICQDRRHGQNLAHRNGIVGEDGNRQRHPPARVHGRRIGPGIEQNAGDIAKIGRIACSHQGGPPTQIGSVDIDVMIEQEIDGATKSACHGPRKQRVGIKLGVVGRNPGIEKRARCVKVVAAKCQAQGFGCCVFRSKSGVHAGSLPPTEKTARTLRHHRGV